jgi:hypothetical protein
VLLVGQAIPGRIGAVVPRRPSIPSKIDTGAEPSSHSSQNHDPARPVAGDAPQLHVQRFAQLRIHRIQLIGTVHRQLHDMRGWLLSNQ